MRVCLDDLWLCVDCLMAAVNGDFTALDNHPETADERMAEISAGLESLGPHLVPDFDSEADTGIRFRNYCQCDCCQSAKGGTFHRFATLTPG